MIIRIFKSNNSMFLIESLDFAAEDITNQLNMHLYENFNFFWFSWVITMAIIVFIVFIYFLYILYILYLYTNVLRWFMRIKID